MLRDVIIYIHGVSPDESLVTVTDAYMSEGQRPTHRSGHAPAYTALHEGVARRMSNPARRAAWQGALHCHTEWGWEYEDSDARLGASHRLIDAQHHLAQRTIRKMKRPWFWGSLMSPMRKLQLYGLSDVFYYVTQDGRISIRDRIADQIGASLGELLDEPDAQLSFTLVGHSAGSVISLDIVTFLLADEQSFIDDLDSLKERESALKSQIGRFDRGGRRTKGSAVIADTLEVVQRQRKLLTGIQEKRFTLRRLFTMGSPITMLALRSDEDIRSLAYGNPMPLVQLGFGHANGTTNDQRDTLRWANIWDIRDPISFPVEPLVEESPVVKDFHVRTSLNFVKSHTAYWTSHQVHGVIAEQW